METTVHCKNCTKQEEQMVYIDQYANGEEWKCLNCDETFIVEHPNPKQQ